MLKASGLHVISWIKEEERSEVEGRQRTKALAQGPLVGNGERYMRSTAIKIFDVEEGTIPGGYQIVVRDKSGQQTHLIQARTQREAHEELQRHGYQFQNAKSERS
jgi:hypothetical protein